MLIVGITGGIGSGKSIICRIFEQLGVAVYDADTEAKSLMNNDATLIKELKRQFGNEIYNSKDGLNRKKLSEIVFKDKEQLEKLNSIVHPFVRRYFQKWKKEHMDSKYLVKEAAILFESGADEDCDRIITVVAPNELRIKRVMDRDDVTKERVEAVMKNQSSSSDKIKRSDFVITNDNQYLVIPQVLDLHEGFLKQYREFR